MKGRGMEKGKGRQGGSWQRRKDYTKSELKKALLEILAKLEQKLVLTSFFPYFHFPSRKVQFS